MSANSNSDRSNQMMQRRGTVRYFAAGISAVIAGIYFLIGFHIVSVLDGNADQTWGLLAGTAYAFGALLLLFADHRVLWILGAVLQVFVIFIYFNVASQRTPPYEVWGIVLRVAQLFILIALMYLATRLPSPQTTTPNRA